MCDPTGISETALIAGLGAEAAAGSAAAAAAGTASMVAADAGIAGSFAAASTAAASAGSVVTELAPTVAGAGGLFGSGISGTTALGIGAPLATMGLSMFGRLAAQTQNAGLYIQNAYAQNRALAQNYNGLGLQQSQSGDKAATDNFDIVRGMAVAKGKATAAAGEAGVGGVSYANVLSDFEMREGLAKSNNDFNYTANIARTQQEKEALRSRTVANISGMPVGNQAGMFAGIAADAITGGLKIYEAGNKGGLWGDETPTGTTNIKSRS